MARMNVYSVGSKRCTFLNLPPSYSTNRQKGRFQRVKKWVLPARTGQVADLVFQRHLPRGPASRKEYRLSKVP
jgi:hypothetical protein